MNAMEVTEYDCSVEITLRLIGGKWKILLLWELMRAGVLRSGELHSRIPGVTIKMMVQQLRELEEDMLIERKVYPVVPARVEYRLTPFGETFRPVMKSMCDWGDAYRSKRI